MAAKGCISLWGSFFSARVRCTGQALFRPPDRVRPVRRTQAATNLRCSRGKQEQNKLVIATERRANRGKPAPRLVTDADDRRGATRAQRLGVKPGNGDQLRRGGIIICLLTVQLFWVSENTLAPKGVRVYNQHF